METASSRAAHGFAVWRHDIDEGVYLADRVVVLSASTAHVKEVIAVELPQPRDQIATSQLPEFAPLRGKVFASIKAETSGSGERAEGKGFRGEQPDRTVA